MKKIVLLICSTFIFHSMLVTAIVDPKSAQAQDSQKTTSMKEVADGALQSGDTVISEAEYRAAKQSYYGKNSSPLCEAKNHEDCRSDGACCTGGPRCLLLLEKIKKNSSVITRYFIKNFCT